MTTDKTKVKERPILFSGPMVRAILEGRKTQTRRVVTPQPKDCNVVGCSDNWIAIRRYPSQYPTAHRPRIWKRWHTNWSALRRLMEDNSPYGKPGERLWVKETWQIHEGREGTQCVSYAADFKHGFAQGEVARAWKPSIFMPRWASRLALEIVAVRVERLADIMIGDCLAEGIQLTGKDTEELRGAYKKLWNSLNMPRPGCSWTDNPWVWVIEFRKL